MIKCHRSQPIYPEKPARYLLVLYIPLIRALNQYLETVSILCDINAIFYGECKQQKNYESSGDIEKEVISNTFNVAFLLDFITISFSFQRKVLHVESRKINPGGGRERESEMGKGTFHISSILHHRCMCLLGIEEANKD